MSKSPGAFSLAREAQDMRIRAMDKLEKGPGKTAKKRAMYEDVLSDLKTAVTMNPDDAEIRENIGDVFCALEQDAAALYHYRKALRIEPDSDHARLGVLKILLQKKNFPEAVSCAETGIVFHPRMSILWHALGVSCMGTKNFKRAVEAFTEAQKQATPDDEKVIPDLHEELRQRIREAEERMRMQAVARRFAPRQP